MGQLIGEASTKIVLFAPIASAFTLLGTSGVAHTATLASGALSGGPTQSIASCYIFNAGTTPIAILSREIRSQFTGTIGGRFYDDCGTTLAAGDICGIAHHMNNTQGYACRVSMVGSKKNVRGIMEIRDAAGSGGNGFVLANPELRWHLMSRWALAGAGEKEGRGMAGVRETSAGSGYGRTTASPGEERSPSTVLEIKVSRQTPEPARRSASSDFRLKTVMAVSCRGLQPRAIRSHPIRDCERRSSDGKTASPIQKRAYEFRNRHHPKIAVYFHRGGLARYPPQVTRHL